jgi:hypothetical protein
MYKKSKMGQQRCTEDTTKIFIAENIAAVLQLQDTDRTRRFSNMKLMPNALS